MCCLSAGGSVPGFGMVAPTSSLEAKPLQCFKTPVFVALCGHPKERLLDKRALVKVCSATLQFGAIWLRTDG